MAYWQIFSHCLSGHIIHVFLLLWPAGGPLATFCLFVPYMLLLVWPTDGPLATVCLSVPCVFPSSHGLLVDHACFLTLAAYWQTFSHWLAIPYVLLTQHGWLFKVIIFHVIHCERCIHVFVYMYAFSDIFFLIFRSTVLKWHWQHSSSSSKGGDCKWGKLCLLPGALAD